MSAAPTLSLLIVFLLAIAIPAVFIILSSVVGPKAPNEDKLGPYECGITPRTDSRQRFPVKFYLVAVFFILFDIEVAFMYPWAVNFRSFLEAGARGGVAFLSMLTFILMLGVGLVYVIRKGALKWD